MPRGGQRPLCSIRHCDRVHHARGLCNKHYQRWREEDAPRACSVERCERKYRARGLCDTHYAKWRRETKPPPRIIRHGCLVENCDRPHSSKGYCSRHYNKVRKWGDPHHSGLRSNAERFIKKIWIDLETECWLWTGALDKRGGYAHFSYHTTGRYGKHKGGSLRQIVLAHRLAHEWWNGPIPLHYHVDHLCSRRHCVNPDHLEAVPPIENWRRGHQRRAAGFRAAG